MSPSFVSKRRVRVAGAGAAAVAVAAALVSVAPAHAAPAEGHLIRAAAGRAIPNSWIVVFKPNQGLRATDVTKTAKDLSAAHSGRIKHTYTGAVQGFSATLSEAEAAEVAADGRVAYVQENGRVHLETTQSNATWGIDRIDQRDRPLSGTYSYSTTASNVSVYVIDTGILASHSQLGGRVVDGFDAVDKALPATDCNGHGTHVSGTIGGSTYGVAKGVRLYAVRVLDCTGYGEDANVVAAVDWVTAHAKSTGRPAVANMSIGGSTSTAIDDAIGKSIAAGVTYAVAAGNETTDACAGTPSRVPAAITVGATTSTDARASYSNYGTCVDIFAPGSSVTSSWIGSNSATNTISGTSMATPHVAGAAALYLANNPLATPAQVANALTTTATSGKVTSPLGSPNKLLYVDPGTITPGKSFENTTDVTITDNSATSPAVSSIAVTGVTGNAPATLQVTVNIMHSYIGDLKVELLAPDGNVAATLHNQTGSSTANINQTYTVNASTKVASGTWKLRVYDLAAQDTGYINSWKLTF